MKKIQLIVCTLIISVPLFASMQTANMGLTFTVGNPTTAAQIFLTQGDQGFNYALAGYAPNFSAPIKTPITQRYEYTLNVISSGAVSIKAALTLGNMLGLQAIDFSLNGVEKIMDLSSTATVAITTLPGAGKYPLSISVPATYNGSDNYYTTAGTGTTEYITITATNQV